MSKYKLGVLGGMGSFATSVFFERIIAQIEASKDQEHLDMIILNHATLPDRTDLIMNEKKQLFIEAIKNDIKLFEQAGVANIAIPCNTSHYFLEDIQRLTTIPVIHMVRDTVVYIASMIGDNKKVAVLATDGTVSSGVYQKEVESQNLELHSLAENIQQRVMDIIYSVKSDIAFKSDELDHIIHHLVEEQGCAVVILACTELSTVKLTKKSEQYSVDALEILVQESIIQSGKKIKDRKHE